MGERSNSVGAVTSGSGWNAIKVGYEGARVKCGRRGRKERGAKQGTAPLAGINGVAKGAGLDREREEGPIRGTIKGKDGWEMLGRG